MQVPPTPIDEPHRLEALRFLNLLDSKPQAQFDSVVASRRSCSTLKRA